MRRRRTEEGEDGHEGRRGVGEGMRGTRSDGKGMKEKVGKRDGSEKREK